MTYHYLASPYTHPHEDVRLHRYELALDAVACLLQQKLWTYSPIVHCHPLALLYHLPTTYLFWQQYNHSMLRSAKALLILSIDGWDESLGVSDEILLAKKLNLPIQFLHPLDDTYTIREAM